MEKWTELYHHAMKEPKTTKLLPLLDEAIDAVVDQIEDTLARPHRQVGDLTLALNDLRSRRKEFDVSKSHDASTSLKPMAA